MKLKSVIYGLLALFFNVMSGQSQASLITYDFESGSLSPFSLFGTGSASVAASTLDADGNAVLPYEGSHMAMIVAGDGQSGGLKLFPLPENEEGGDIVSFYWRFLALSDDPFNDPINATFRFAFGGSGVFTLIPLASTNSPGTDWTRFDFILPPTSIGIGDIFTPSSLYFNVQSDGSGLGVALIDGVTYRQTSDVPTSGTLSLALLALLMLSITSMRKRQLSANQRRHH